MKSNESTLIDRPVSVSHDTYFPEIDGLRCIAVLSVFLFHLDSSLVPGGFTGVDVFFVISGFLITGLILKGLDGEGFSYWRFYQRRIARIAPAAAFVIFASLVAGLFIFDRQELGAIGANAAAAALSVMNVKQLFEGGYFKASPDSQPLIHYWSLAVEEQFYIVFPVLAHLLTRFGKRHRSAILIVACLIGYLASIVFTPIAPIPAYYLLHTRAWELLAGAVLASLSRDTGRSEWPWAAQRLYVGLGLILLGMVIARGTGFPGWIAILPVAGSALVLSAVDAPLKTVAHTILSSPVPVFIGQISYSLYLWHWPIFSFVSYQFYRSTPVESYAIKIVLSFVAAIASYYLVEQPARSYLNRADRRIFTFGAFAVVSLALAGWGVQVRRANYLSASSSSMTQGGIVINAGRPQTVALIGDSQGAMYGYDMGQIALANGFTLNVFAQAANNELPGEPNTQWPKIAQYLDQHHFDVIVVAQAWADKLGPAPRDEMNRALDALAPYTDRIVLIGQLPNAPSDDLRQSIFAGWPLPVYETADARTKRMKADTVLASLSGPQVSVMRVDDMMIAPDGSLRLIAPNGRVAYRDHGHLSSSGSALLRPRLEKAVLEALKSGR